MSADSTGADLLLRSPVQYAVSVANMAHTDAVAKSVEDSDLTMSILEEMRVQFEFKAFGINRHSATGVPTGLFAFVRRWANVVVVLCCVVLFWLFV